MKDIMWSHYAKINCNTHVIFSFNFLRTSKVQLGWLEPKYMLQSQINNWMYVIKKRLKSLNLTRIGVKTLDMDLINILSLIPR